MEAATQSRTAVDVHGHVAEVRMTRPDKHNALDFAMFESLNEALLRLRDERGVRVVVLHGEGPSFCSGLDFPSFLAEGRPCRQQAEEQ